MSSNSLPPLRNLPQWSRVGCLDKYVVPRPSPVKHLHSLFDPPSSDRGVAVSTHSDMDTRVLSLQRNIQFLQLQHKDTLQKLHGEIDDLRRENKDLQYKMIMETPKSCRKGTSRRATRPPTQGSEAYKGFYQEQALQDTRLSQDPCLSSLGDCGETSGPPRQEYKPELRGGLITSLQPLRIHSSPAHPPRAPTLQECEIIIRQLYNANSVQSQEIVRVKAVLRDIVFNKKITPENYILTKSYLADGTRAETEKFPKLALQPQPNKTSGSQVGVAERVILPALKQSLNSSIAERQKRTQAVQRSRLRNTLH
ncbi:LOW QUALITY PROTEIN: coiled-coil domain-containing protein 74A [Hypomesus transpacificus]|uniref:LOW QUALITY PROTEIN: coiled-coil domain-containing protein 74A n=1 Tax=Hypomesus transpacificus TaxID=137520 RepID=UPI001F07D344|nr:LOW QUALITY PROTEIN: coiled-coil domain-containing protein 74A [Hypomesus transpacificus]